MYGIFTYIYHKNQPNVGKYTSPMDGMGMISSKTTTSALCVFSKTQIDPIGVVKLVVNQANVLQG